MQANAAMCLNYKENGARNHPWEPPLLKIGGERVISVDFLQKLGVKDRLEGDFAKAKNSFFHFPH